MLNIIWATFFILALCSALWQSINGNLAVWQNILNSIFTSADNGFKISIGLTGVLCFWLGLLKIAEKSGMINILAKFLTPFFHAIMPDIPKNSPAFGSIVMNVAANVLGLDNAATPMGLKAMEQLQQHNPHKDKASNSQTMFLILNSSSLTLLPITIMLYRFQMGSSNPSLVFVPILIATTTSTLAGFLITALWQKINIFQPIILSYLIAGILFALGLIYIFQQDEFKTTIPIISNIILYSLIMLFIIGGLIKHLKVYEIFIDGAKEGFKIAIQIIPYLVAMLVAIGVFRASGGFDYMCDIIVCILQFFNINTDFAAALPTALMKPLSGNGARSLMLDTFNTYGVDSFAGFTASIVQGSTETTFYVLAVYFGAVKITKTGATLPLALFADFCGIVSAIILAYIFY